MVVVKKCAPLCDTALYFHHLVVDVVEIAFGQSTTAAAVDNNVDIEQQQPPCAVVDNAMQQLPVEESDEHYREPAVAIVVVVAFAAEPQHVADCKNKDKDAEVELLPA
mmetsp:Transcript_2248/g.2971  ORF Transcript_2248/g.2971 Transcript_2248/m.2971 type:complete len:108 (-) Transcript_2248:1096-1419(-)